MKWILRFFALLDLICVVLLAEQAYAQFKSFTTNETFTAIQFFSRSLFITGWFSLIISAALLFACKKAGIILYYFQLPVRFIFFMFSFGFISLLTYVTNWQFLLNIITPVVIFGEFVRLYVTYKSTRMEDRSPKKLKAEG